MIKVLVLGASGMLGSMVYSVLKKNSDFDVYGTVSSESKKSLFKDKKLRANLKVFLPLEQELWSIIDYDSYIIINCIGKTKPNINLKDLKSIEEVKKININFPHQLDSYARKTNSHVYHISTDCVFSGEKGNYLESDIKNAKDIYGLSKSQGEVESTFVTNTRCSLIGTEVTGKKNLLEWFLCREKNEQILGYKDHFWNGITSLHMAKILEGIIINKFKLPNVIHIVPEDSLDKYQLLKLFAKYFLREDLIINPIRAGVKKDFRLKTNHKKINKEMWRNASYNGPLAIAEMLEELSNFVKNA